MFKHVYLTSFSSIYYNWKRLCSVEFVSEGSFYDRLTRVVQSFDKCRAITRHLSCNRLTDVRR